MCMLYKYEAQTSPQYLQEEEEGPGFGCPPPPPPATHLGYNRLAWTDMRNTLCLYDSTCDVATVSQGLKGYAALGSKAAAMATRGLLFYLTCLSSSCLARFWSISSFGFKF